MKIFKFGGTLLATSSLREKIIHWLKSWNQEKIIVVCSAMGRNGFPYATDTLLKLIEEGKLSEKEIARFISVGEIISSLLFTSDCIKNGLNATSLSPLELGIKTDSTYLDANIIQMDGENIVEALKEHDIVIVPGFLGTNDNHEITTLGRGGGDLTPLALADFFHLSEVYLFKDVQGVFPSQPLISKKILPYQKLSYLEMRWLIDMGYNVLQRKAIMFAEKKKIHIYVGKIDDENGTWIQEENSKENCIGCLATHQKILLAAHDLNRVYQEVQERLAHKHIFIKEYEMEGAILTMSLPSSQITVAKREIISFYWDKQ